MKEINREYVSKSIGHGMRRHDTQHVTPIQDPKTLLTKRHRQQPHYYHQQHQHRI